LVIHGILIDYNCIRINLSQSKICKKDTICNLFNIEHIKPVEEAEDLHGAEGVEDVRVVANVSSEPTCAAPSQEEQTYQSATDPPGSKKEKKREKNLDRRSTRFGVVAGQDPFDDLGGVNGVELVEQVERGEAPVGAVEPDMLHHQRLERVLLRRG
jgi:hypothetical protein